MEFVELTRGGGVPAHVRIERRLRAAIDSGEIAPGDRLPGERDLAARLGVSRMTLRQALAALAAQGALVRVPGRSGGAFVADPADRRAECDLTGLAGFTEQMRRAHLTAQAWVLRAATAAAPEEVAAALELEGAARVHEISRVRSAGGSPVALEHSFFPAAPLPGLLERDLTGSLYALLTTAYGLRPSSAVEHLDPVVADDGQAAHLGVAAGTPLMRIERTAYTAEGVPLEYARDLFRPDRVRVTVRTG
ncbi:GntR family transcriptional regulator [Nonomuraea longicatena]|uniref:GntR family transcriptional regulator n=1 Tax=Nonomuraea longicatena TaxID=83682 RepID=A0ABP3ZNK7_9ACTN